MIRDYCPTRTFILLMIVPGFTGQCELTSQEQPTKHPMTSHEQLTKPKTSLLT